MVATAPAARAGVVYVYNFSALPIDDGSPLAGTLREIVAFANLGLAAFVTASVAVRFVFPAISLEGARGGPSAPHRSRSAASGGASSGSRSCRLPSSAKP